MEADHETKFTGKCNVSVSFILIAFGGCVGGGKLFRFSVFLTSTIAKSFFLLFLAVFLFKLGFKLHAVNLVDHDHCIFRIGCTNHNRKYQNLSYILRVSIFFCNLCFHFHFIYLCVCIQCHDKNNFFFFFFAF